MNLSCLYVVVFLWGGVCVLFTHSMMVETTLYFMKKHINICWPFPPLVMYSALMVDQEASRKLCPLGQTLACKYCVRLIVLVVLAQ